MSNDLISREALKKAICPYDNTDYCQDIETILNIIDNAPTVELFCSYLSDGEVRQPCVESPCEHERPQGEWIVDEFGRKICGKCQFPFAEFQSNNYCSLCGADMRKNDGRSEEE